MVRTAAVPAAEGAVGALPCGVTPSSSPDPVVGAVTLSSSPDPPRLIVGDKVVGSLVDPGAKVGAVVTVVTTTRTGALVVPPVFSGTGEAEGTMVSFS